MITVASTQPRDSNFQNGFLGRSTQNNPFLAKNAFFFQENHQKLESIKEVALKWV